MVGARAAGAAWRGHDAGHSNLILASIYDDYLVGPSIRPACTRRGFPMTDLVQVCSNLLCARAFIINTRPDEIYGSWFGVWGFGFG